MPMSLMYIKRKNYIKCGIFGHVREELFSENEVNQSSSKSKKRKCSFQNKPACGYHTIQQT